MAGHVADMRASAPAGLAFSTIVVLLALLAYAAFRLFGSTYCGAASRVAGYWSSPGGDLFEIRPAGGPQTGEYAVTTASGFMGAAPTGAYPVAKKGCRSVSILLPGGEMRGRVGLDRRRIVWDRAPTWFRQGI